MLLLSEGKVEKHISLLRLTLRQCLDFEPQRYCGTPGCLLESLLEKLFPLNAVESPKDLPWFRWLQWTNKFQHKIQGSCKSKRSERKRRAKERKFFCLKKMWPFLQARTTTSSLASHNNIKNQACSLSLLLVTIALKAPEAIRSDFTSYFFSSWIVAIVSLEWMCVYTVSQWLLPTATGTLWMTSQQALAIPWGT